MSLKKMKSADKRKPIPRLIKIKHIIGYSNSKKCQEKLIPSRTTKTKYISKIIPKFISADIFFENKNKYLGTFIFVKIDALLTRANIPSLVASTK